MNGSNVSESTSWEARAMSPRLEGDAADPEAGTAGLGGRRSIVRGGRGVRDACDGRGEQEEEGEEAHG